MIGFPQFDHDVKQLVRRGCFLRLRAWAVGGAIVCSLLIGCDQGEPTGQVAARVNGEEITIPELNSEARARGLIIGDNPALRKSLLSDLIDRKLLVQLARKERLDRTPDYLLAERRADEILLTQQLSADGEAGRDISAQEIAAEIRSNPFAFEKRVLFHVDQITISPAVSNQTTRALGSAKSLDRMQSLLTSRRVAFSRRPEFWDSATLPPSMTERLLAAKPGAVILLPVSQGTAAVQIESVSAQPTSAQDEQELARELLQSRRAEQLLQAELQRAKSSADIRYQPQFFPNR